MPWKEVALMDERLRFVAKLLDGEAMSDVCREFGISRKTGYKVLTATRTRGWKRSVTGLAGRCAMPISCPTRSSP
jgi:transposase